MRWASEIIDIEREIDKLPQGYDTPLGKGISETLPTPLIKRVLMARVLAQKPVLWALDEPQTELDARGKATFIKTIQNLSGWMTVVFTTNCAKTANSADRIFYIQNGRLTIYNSYGEMRESLLNSDLDLDRVEARAGQHVAPAEAVNRSRK